MSNVSQWNASAASNNSAPPDGAPEGQAPGTVNDVMREIMAAVARQYQDSDGSIITAGSSNAYTLTTNNVHAALADMGLTVFRADRSNTGAATLNVDSLGAKSIESGGTALGSGELVQDSLYVACYNATNDTYDLLNAAAIGLTVQGWDAQLDDIAALAFDDGNIIVGDGSNWVAESGATARTSLGADDASSLTTGALPDARLSSNVALLDGSVFTGAVDLDGATYLSASWGLDAVISDSFSAQQDDYAPTGHATANVWRLTPTGAQNISGIAGGVAGRRISIFNLGSSQITFQDESASSTAANRIRTSGAGLAVTEQGGVELWYDGTSSRWRIVSNP